MTTKTQKNKLFSKTFILANAAFFTLILTFDCLFMFTDISSYITKVIASALFVLCGLFNFVYAKKYYPQADQKFGILMLIGLVFAMAGDILIIDNFVIGAALFAVGHVFFTIAFLLLNKFSYKDLLIWLGLSAICITVLLMDWYNYNGMFPLIVAYALIISLMLAKAISNSAFASGLSVMFKTTLVVGGSLFFFSDMMLLFNAFGKLETPAFSILCLSTYYVAEFLLAISISIFAICGKKKSVETKTIEAPVETEPTAKKSTAKKTVAKK